MTETLYDYERQAWIVDGAYDPCAHADNMRCGCYGREHGGEAVEPDRLKRIRAQQRMDAENPVY